MVLIYKMGVKLIQTSEWGASITGNVAGTQVFAFLSLPLKNDCLNNF
jgi:hypothetical protein